MYSAKVRDRKNARGAGQIRPKDCGINQKTREKEQCLKFEQFQQMKDSVEVLVRQHLIVCFQIRYLVGISAQLKWTRRIDKELSVVEGRKDVVVFPTPDTWHKFHSLLEWC